MTARQFYSNRLVGFHGLRLGSAIDKREQGPPKAQYLIIGEHRN